MKKIILMAMLLGCTSEDKSRKALESAGFTSIEFHGWAMFGCSESDSQHTKFTATNPLGKQVSGVVCCDYIKACTIRF